MKIDLEFVELNTPLFLNNINFGTKITPQTKGRPVTMWYDTDHRHTIIISGNKVAIVEETASMTMYDPSQLGIQIDKPKQTTPTKETLVDYSKPPIKAQLTGPERTIIRPQAQVETPIDRVQGTPGRKAKYQGQES